MASAPTVAIRVYFRGKPDGEIRHIPARFFRWHPAYHGRKSYVSYGSSLGGRLERARDDYVRKIAPGNVGWEEVYGSAHYEKAARTNPGVGMPGMPHTWVTKSGAHVSGGDTVEYWSKEGLARDAKPERRRAKVNRMLVFPDHVMVSRGQFGNYVSDDNFIRVVRKGG